MDKKIFGAISDRLEEVLTRIRRAEAAASREPGSVELVAVSKNHPPEAVREALTCGQTLFGENRVQELVAKAAECPAAARWHHIGHLQSNKIRKVLPAAELLHGVDSVDLARTVDRVAGELGLFPRILLEVNLTRGASRFGFPPEAVERDLDDLLGLPRVRVEGFMGMAPVVEKASDARPYFAALRELRDRCAARAGVPLPTLSMGMSGDYEAAIAEGSTLVRVGSAIFGERPSAGEANQR